MQPKCALFTGSEQQCPAKVKASESRKKKKKKKKVEVNDAYKLWRV